MNKITQQLDDPKVAKKIHGWLAIIWLGASVPVCIFLKDSVPFLVFISVYAVVSSHWSGWDAAGAELEIEKVKSKLKAER